MAKRSRGVRNKQIAKIKSKQPQRLFRVRITTAAFALLGTTGACLLATYNDALAGFIKSAEAPSWAWIQDHLFPMPDDKLIGVDLRFYVPSSVEKGRVLEGASATFYPTLCKRPEGASIVAPIDDGEGAFHTNAIVKISCRASGRTLVTLTPESGATVTVYDGIFDDGDQLAFPGVPGSYYAGRLTLHWLDTKPLDGPRVPVNQCPTQEACEKEFASLAPSPKQYQ